jgi:hypothetical protein
VESAEKVFSGAVMHPVVLLGVARLFEKNPSKSTYVNQVNKQSVAGMYVDIEQPMLIEEYRLTGTLLRVVLMRLNYMMEQSITVAAAAGTTKVTRMEKSFISWLQPYPVVNFHKLIIFDFFQCD